MGEKKTTVTLLKVTVGGYDGAEIVEPTYNPTSVNYLDINLNFETVIHQPYINPMTYLPMFIYAKSNHPPHIIRHIPVAVSKRISMLSSNRDVFNAAVRL